MFSQNVLFESDQDFTPIPIRLMDNEYYTNWLPIEEMNACSDERQKMLLKQKLMKNGGISKKRKKTVVRRKTQGSEDYSYFKMREQKKEENKRKQIVKKSAFQTKNDNLQQKYLSQRKPNLTKPRTKIKFPHPISSNQLNRRYQKLVQPSSDKNSQKNYPSSQRVSNNEEITRKRKKSIREEDRVQSKNRKKLEKNKYILLQVQNDLPKAEEIAFDYYGIPSTSISESREKEAKVCFK